MSSIRNMPNEMSVAIIDSASASITAVAAVPGKRILVWGYSITADASTHLTVESGTTAITGPMKGTVFTERLPMGLPESCVGYPLYETVAGEALVLSQASAVQVGGVVYYSVI